MKRALLLAVVLLALGVSEARASEAGLTGAAARHYIGVSLREEREDRYITGWQIHHCNRKNALSVKCWVVEYGVWEFIPGENPPGYSTVLLGLTATRWPCWVRLTLDYSRPAGVAAYPRC